MTYYYLMHVIEDRPMSRQPATQEDVDRVKLAMARLDKECKEAHRLKLYVPVSLARSPRRPADSSSSCVIAGKARNA